MFLFNISFICYYIISTYISFTRLNHRLEQCQQQCSHVFFMIEFLLIRNWSYVFWYMIPAWEGIRCLFCEESAAETAFPDWHQQKDNTQDGFIICMDNFPLSVLSIAF